RPTSWLLAASNWEARLPRLLPAASPGLLPPAAQRHEDAPLNGHSPPLAASIVAPAAVDSASIVHRPRRPGADLDNGGAVGGRHPAQSAALERHGAAKVGRLQQLSEPDSGRDVPESALAHRLFHGLHRDPTNRSALAYSEPAQFRRPRKHGFPDALF